MSALIALLVGGLTLAILFVYAINKACDTTDRGTNDADDSDIPDRIELHETGFVIIKKRFGFYALAYFGHELETFSSLDDAKRGYHIASYFARTTGVNLWPINVSELEIGETGIDKDGVERTRVDPMFLFNTTTNKLEAIPICKDIYVYKK